ncbi:MAG: DNA-protecting protein DprA [Phenylobacterium sp.]|uniref:DNA-processing protein DprA n=1 Tax=Phenylobacterium sp. TaxID=1871053 RepID=UPI001214164B|nr:DNA-processing protein DprA [Phenylobacterium sp.]TAL29653.1 MAG: DNA-protecting protein DprA [Phenylobacterium sp.]
MKPSVHTAPAGKGVALDLADERYPAWLRAIPSPPAVLYCDGLVEPRDRQAVAIVGARQATPHGLRTTETLARELSGAGFTIVSGLARGIDAAAHRAALDAGGRTIAVLGCGLDVTYPPEHARLREEIAGCGAVLTEFPAGTQPKPAHFPQRNRIISGLSLGVVVVEAAEDSGSLITARRALEQGREVFAVPGSIDAPLSRGPHGLIKQGAKLVEAVDDIVEELLPQLDMAGMPKRRSVLSKAEALPNLSPEERLLLDQMDREPLHLDDLTERSHLTSAGVAGILLGLELKDVVRQLPGQRYYRLK